MTELEQQLAEALKIGVEMRRLQAIFFKLTPGPTRTDALMAAKNVEARFDRDARAALRSFYSAEETGR